MHYDTEVLIRLRYWWEQVDISVPRMKRVYVEIGFSIMPAWQNFGYATELAELLIKNAFTDGRVLKVIAHTTPMNLASCKVLEKCGFNYPKFPLKL
ncbi:MAG TPA: GNAT family N-acetyltransferase [Syntrophales bacterium]|nr:GNAT family N-acetyltransferase [Syntrophales bacterium]HQB14445.1 GNAT family N-acetyltransferase [Syntrophales bacterium]